jgi:hypothetical protein
VRDLAGALLVAGLTALVAGAGLPPAKIWTASDDERLDLIRSHRARWIASAAGIGTAVVLTTAGLVVLAPVLSPRGAGILPVLAAAAFGFGGVLFVIELTFRATVTVRVAGGGRPVPDWFEPLRAWAGAAFGAYTVLAYVAVAALGCAFLKAEVFPRGVAWAVLGFGVAGTAVYVARVPRALWALFEIPGLLYLVTGGIGVGLLVTST